MKTRDKYKKLFDTLKIFEIQSTEFNRKRLADRTGYSEGTIGVYIRNKLRNTFVFDTDSKMLIANGITAIDFATFYDFMSQKGKKARHQSNLYTTLRERSLQAFYNAISIYNNPIREYRVESFCILLANSWEILLKARIIETLGESEIYRKDGKTISFKRAIEKIFEKPKEPARKNLELLNDIRNQAIHLLLPDIQNTLSRIFQASVFNYLKILHSFNYPNPYMRENPGLLTLVTDISDIENRIIKIKYGDNTAVRINEFLKHVEREEKDTIDPSYIIPVEYKVVLTKSEKEGDFKISSVGNGHSALLVNVPKDHNKTHPYRSTDVIEKVNDHFQNKIVTQYTFQGILLKEKIRNSAQNQYYYLIENPKTHKFSQELVDLIINKCEANKNYLTLAKEKYRKYLEKRRKLKRINVT